MSEYSPWRKWIAGLLFCVLAGAATEIAQSLFGGDASAEDFLRDLVGGLLTLSLLPLTSGPISRKNRRAARALTLSFLMAAMVPLFIAVCDELIASSEFPVLSDFETPFEKSRWEGGSRIKVDSTVARHGKSSLRVEMDTSEYSGVSLVHFPRNWNGNRMLVLDVYNPSANPLEITLRIHDLRHEEANHLFHDRFNRPYLLPAGWNEIRVDLADVAKSPEGRRMDLENVRNLRLFAVKLPAPRSMYLDYVRLE